jgi:hypothetical protein
MPAPPFASNLQTAAETTDKQFWNRILFCGLLLWTFLSLCYPLYDTDFWWHLKTGEWILREGTVPQVDLYTFTEENTQWIDLHWGFQILITWLNRLGGVKLVILVKAAVITAAVAVGWSAGGQRLPVWLKTLLWIAPVTCITGRGDVRPEMLSLLFLAIWLWIASRVEAHPRLIWLLTIVHVVWVNCHALFVLGLVVGGCYVIDYVARDIARGRWGLEPSPYNPSASAIIRVGGLVVLACLANPYFELGAKFPLTLYDKFTVDQDFYSANIGEFRRPVDFIRIYGWRAVTNIYMLAEIGVWCSTAASFVWLFARKRRWSVMRLLLFAAFSHLAWKATRNTNIFSLVAACIACENFGAGLALAAEPASMRRQRFWNWGVAAVLTGLICAVVTGGWNEIGDRNKPFRLGEARWWFIHDAAKFAGQSGFPRRAFVANNGQAAVFAYHNAPGQKVFMDARLEVCSRKTFEAFNEIIRKMATLDPSWEAVFNPKNDDDLPVVILDSRGSDSRAAINGLLNTRGWRLVFADHTAAVFLTTARADRLSLPAADPRPLIHPPEPSQ